MKATRILILFFAAGCGCHASTRSRVENERSMSLCRSTKGSLPKALEEWKQDSNGQFSLARETDLDGDGEPDALTATHQGGSGGGGLKLEVLLASGQRFSVGTWAPFTNFVEVTDVPEEVATSLPLRHAMENVLFDKLCDAPDATFAWLTSEEPALHWHAGPPVLPERYTFYTDDVALLRMLDDKGYVIRSEDPAVVRTIPKTAWITVKNQFGKLRELARSANRVVLATDHGVLLTDPERTRHAWVYIFEGDMKLRFSAIRSAQIAGDELHIELYLGQFGVECSAKVSLLTGAHSDTCDGY